MTKNQKIVTILFALVWIWAAVNPVSRTDWFLENIPVFAAFIALAFIKKRLMISDLSFALIAIFMSLHLAGTHYTYEQVPFGFTLEDWLGSTRNMYDRLVHFAFGFLLLIPVQEVFFNSSNLNKDRKYILPVITIGACASVYEIFEWVMTNFVNTHTSIIFLGSQGDMWDTQKDMAMAFFGALSMTVVNILYRKWKAR